MGILELVLLIIFGPVYLAMAGYVVARLIKRGLDDAQIEHMKKFVSIFGDSVANTSSNSGEDKND